MVRFLLVLALMMLAACGPPPAVSDAGPPNDTVPAPTDRTLTFEPAGSLTLQPGVRQQITVMLRDNNGNGVGDVVIGLALIGTARDGSLSETRVTTSMDPLRDPVGLARFTLTTPSDIATFNVRASTPRAPDAMLLVSVSGRGFGGVTVAAPYSGVRTPDHLDIRLFEGVRCAQLDHADALRTLSLPPAGGSVTFAGLPATQTFAVQGLAVGGTRDVLARSCVDNLLIVRDEMRSAALVFEDLPLQASGGYALEFAFNDLGTLTSRASADWVLAVQRIVEMAGGEPAYLLDAIGDAVETRSGTTARAEYDRAVRERLLEGLRLDLEHRTASATQVLARLATDTATVTQNVKLLAGISVATGIDGVARVTVRSVTLRVDPLTPDVRSDDLERAVMPEGSGEVVLVPVDRVSVGVRSLPLPFAFIARRAADSLLQRNMVTSAAEWARVTTRCREVATLVAGDTAACDSGCVVAACDAAVDRLGQAFDAAVALAGAAHVAANVRFEGAAIGAPGTLRAAGAAPSPFTANYIDEPGLPIVGVATLRTP